MVSQLLSVRQTFYKTLCAIFSVLQMEKVEEDLARSKNLREKQAKESHVRFEKASWVFGSMTTENIDCGSTFSNPVKIP